MQFFRGTRQCFSIRIHEKNTKDPLQANAKNHRGFRFRKAGSKGERRSVRIHKRLLYCVKVNLTSLDHLLLGKCADVDRARRACRMRSV